MKYIFIVLFLSLLCLIGCRHNTTPSIVSAESYIYKSNNNNNTEIHQIENTEFKFVKKGNVYFITKDENIILED